jgi:hypothetical protein
MTAKNEKENNVSIHPPPHGARPGPPAEARASSTSTDSHTVTRHTLAHDWVTLTPVSTRRDLIGLEPRERGTYVEHTIRRSCVARGRVPSVRCGGAGRFGRSRFGSDAKFTI